jgi:hypothetical protein
MATKKIIYDHRGDAVRVLHVDDRDPTGWNSEFTTELVQDVEPLLDDVKALRDYQNPNSNMKHVARVPVTVVEQAMREGWFNDQKAWARFLNDPDNAYLRVWEGRL